MNEDKKTTIFIISVILIFSLKLNLNSQSCNLTLTTSLVFYANTTTVYTPTVNSYLYLCGPNTIVYDTLSNAAVEAIQNTSTTLTIKSNPALYHVIFLKTNSTLKILQGTGLSKIYMEPGAIIINPYGAPTQTFNCSTLNLPTVNCGITSFIEHTKQYGDIIAFPNPAKDILNIEVSTTLDLTRRYYVKLINALGEVILQNKVENYKTLLDLKALPVGLYFIEIKTEVGVLNKKVIIEK